MGRFSADPYLLKSFAHLDFPCWQLSREVWQELTGEDLGDRTPARIAAAVLRGKFDTARGLFEELSAPVSPSLVLMTRRGDIPHVGVFVDGRILQVTASGASYTKPEAATRGYDQVRYYR